MLIGIDGNEANIDKRVGVNMYAFELLCSIYQLQDEWRDKHKFIIYLKNPPRDDLPKGKEFWQYKVLPGGPLWIVTRLVPDLFLTRLKPGIFFSPSHYIPPFAPMPRICSITDLGYLKFSAQFKKKDFWQLKLWSAWSILVSKRIIAISQTTKEDIVRHYPFAKQKIGVTLLGYNKKEFRKGISPKLINKIKKKYAIGDSDYVLYLGTLKPSKNIEGLIEAFNAVISNDLREITKNLKLVIAGKKGWLFQSVFRLISELNLEKRVIFTDYVPDQHIAALIAGAKVFTIPSFWEGFGLDALSAMACGTPVVAGKAGSLPEVIGDAGILVNPNDPNDIAKGISKVLRSPKKEYNKMVSKGLEHVKKYSWEKTAKKTLKILEGVM